MTREPPRKVGCLQEVIAHAYLRSLVRGTEVAASGFTVLFSARSSSWTCHPGVPPAAVVFLGQLGAEGWIWCPGVSALEGGALLLS